MLLDIGRASNSKMHFTSQRLSATSIKYIIDVAASDPLEIGAPDIDADFDLVIDYSDVNHIKYTLNGSYDGFPCYEIFVNDQALLLHDSIGQTAISLFPPQEFTVNKSGELLQ